jgi:hypothetical protein
VSDDDLTSGVTVVVGGDVDVVRCTCGDDVRDCSCLGFFVWPM